MKEEYEQNVEEMNKEFEEQVNQMTQQYEENVKELILSYSSIYFMPVFQNNNSFVVATT